MHYYININKRNSLIYLVVLSRGFSYKYIIKKDIYNRGELAVPYAIWGLGAIYVSVRCFYTEIKQEVNKNLALLILC